MFDFIQIIIFFIFIFIFSNSLWFCVKYVSVIWLHIQQEVRKCSSVSHSQGSGRQRSQTLLILLDTHIVLMVLSLHTHTWTDGRTDGRRVCIRCMFYGPGHRGHSSGFNLLSVSSELNDTVRVFILFNLSCTSSSFFFQIFFIYIYRNGFLQLFATQDERFLKA